MKPAFFGILGLALLAGIASAGEIRGHLETKDLPPYLSDRGEGIPLSMFGTYIQSGQLIVYPFAEYYRDRNYEYAPDELGQVGDRDFRGDYEAHEQLLFLAYGFSERFAVEVEGAIIQAELEKSSEDPSGLPPELTESGVGDVEGQLRWRWRKETPGRPEIFSYFETVLPTQDKGSLIGTTDWEFKLGTGATRGFGWGTLTARGAVEYDRSESAFGIGEIAFEYLKRLSSRVRIYGGVEGTEDEIELITEGQWHVAPNVFVKMNSGFGLTSKATDWAPEFGVLFSF